MLHPASYQFERGNRVLSTRQREGAQALKMETLGRRRESRLLLASKMRSSAWIRGFLSEIHNYLHTQACTASASFYILTIKEQVQAWRPGEWQAAGSQGTFQQEPSSEYPNPLGKV